MILVVVLLSVLLTVISFALYYSVKKNFQMMETLESTMEQIEESLELLEISKKRIEKKLKIELLSDEPIIRDLIDDMKLSKKSLLLISEKLTGIKEVLDEENENEEKQESRM
jgi:hypothetical protein